MDILEIKDLETLAQKRVPKMFFDYVNSGSWTETTYNENVSDFQKIKLRQRVAIDMSNRTLATKMVNQKVSMPVAIAPTGLTGMQRADGEILAAQAAEEGDGRRPALGGAARDAFASFRRGAPGLAGR